MPDVENNPKWVNYVKKLWTESGNPSTINAWHARMQKKCIQIIVQKVTYL